MESLSDKLKSMGVRIGARDLPRPKPRPGYSIDQVIAGETLPTPYGEVFCVQKQYPTEYAHGHTPLAFPDSLERMCEWGRTDGIGGAEAGQFIFLDTETTGLAGGTGTYAFLVGIGRFAPDGFRLAQFFMRDPTEEPALLAGLLESIHPCQALVTFNGKAFDAPLLNTRYRLQGLTSPLPPIPHLDLLPLARRLWRDRLPSRALGYLEVSILGAYRTQEEVPGWMIPQLYFDYLRSGDARPLEGVFYHNAMDILALAALFGHTARMLAHPLEDLIEESLDRIALARLNEDLGHLDEAVLLYRRGLEQGLPEQAFWETVEKLALLYRRMGNWEGAIALWRQAAEKGQVYACVELAKFYEHRLRDIKEASIWTRTGLDLVAAGKVPAFQRRQMLAELEHRMDRLERKSRHEIQPEDDEE